LKSIESYLRFAKATNLLWIALFYFIFSSCAEIPKTCSDPLGSENYTIQICRGAQNLFPCYFCFKGQTVSGSDTCKYNYCYEFYAPDASAAGQIRSLYFNGCSSTSSGSIADLGEVSCLGAVNYKPQTGYVYTLTPKVNHGYVMAFQDGTYGRFYIDSIESQAGQIKIIHMIRQYPF